MSVKNAKSQDLSLRKENGIIAGPWTYSKEPLILQHTDSQKAERKEGVGTIFRANIFCSMQLGLYNSLLSLIC